MSRCRSGTGMSTGSTTVPPERCMWGLAYANFTKFLKSSIVAYRRPSSMSNTNGDP